MSDVEDAVEVGEHGDMYNLLKEVLKNAQVNGSLLHGIHEGAKALEKKLGKCRLYVIFRCSYAFVFVYYGFFFYFAIRSFVRAGQQLRRGYVQKISDWIVRRKQYPFDRSGQQQNIGRMEWSV